MSITKKQIKEKILAGEKLNSEEVSKVVNFGRDMNCEWIVSKTGAFFYGGHPTGSDDIAHSIFKLDDRYFMMYDAYSECQNSDCWPIERWHPSQICYEMKKIDEKKFKKLNTTLEDTLFHKLMNKEELTTFEIKEIIYRNVEGLKVSIDSIYPKRTIGTTTCGCICIFSMKGHIFSILINEPEDKYGSWSEEVENPRVCPPQIAKILK